MTKPITKDDYQRVLLGIEEELDRWARMGLHCTDYIGLTGPALDTVISALRIAKRGAPLGCAADSGDICFPCHAKGGGCEKAQERKG